MVVVDIEASGIYPYENSILSIGAVDFLNPDNQFYGECRLRDGAKVWDKSMDINGFTEKDIQDMNKKTEKQLLENFIQWVDDCKVKVLAGHNFAFDLNFLEYGIYVYNLKKSWSYRFVDLHSIVYFHLVKNGNFDIDLDTDKIMEAVGMPPEPDPHNALNGAKYEAEAFYRLLYGKHLFDEFAKYPVKNIY